MSQADRDRILATISDPAAMAAISMDFEDRIAGKSATLGSMMESLEAGDEYSFCTGLQSELDDPVFDAAFERSLLEYPSLASHATLLAMRGASVRVTHETGSGCDRAVDLFAITVTGHVDDIAEAVSNPTSMAALERAFHQSGLAAPSTRVVLSDTPVDPVAAASTSPGLLRDLLRSFDRFDRSAGTGDDRAELEGEVADFEVFSFDGLPPEKRGVTTVLLFGAAVMEVHPRQQFLPDGLVSQISTDDEEGLHEAAVAAFEELADAATGLEVARPHWFGRALASAALEGVRHSMEAEAACYGLDLSSCGMDGVSMATRQDTILVEGTVQGRTLGPFPVPAVLAEMETEWFVSAVTALGRTLLPGGHLEHGRSAVLN